MENEPFDLLWDAFLTLKNKVQEDEIMHDAYSIVFAEGKYIVEEKAIWGTEKQKSVIVSKSPIQIESSDSLVFFLDEQNMLQQIGEQCFDDSIYNFIIRYLPFCFSIFTAQKLKRTFAVLHMAQALDGRIATKSHHSKWIGNRENLVHAHRMRALCDAILIGNNTLKNDLPLLTVRHVKGSNPIRAIIANNDCNLESLKESEGKILVFTSKEIKPSDGIEIIHIPNSGDFISTKLILKELYKRNIFSLFIEGGAFTASQFVKENVVDVVQIYISPTIIGSGISSFNLPEIQKIDQSISFSTSSFSLMGNGVLFNGIFKN